MSLVAFVANAQNDEFIYSTDFELILSQTQDSTSKYFYSKLLERYLENDSTLTKNEVLALMIGFTANENYMPYQNLDKEREIFNLIGDKKYQEALSKCNELLETNPLNYTALMEKGFALWKLEDERSEFHKSQYFRILHAILFSGDGSQNNAFFVLSPLDGQAIIRYVWQDSIGTMGSGSDENGSYLDILEMKKDGETIHICFNIQHAISNSVFYNQVENKIENRKK